MAFPVHNPGKALPFAPPPMIPTYRRLFCAFFNSNWICFCTTWSLICDLACSNVWRLLGLFPWPCFTCWICRSMLSKSCDKLSNCLFNSAREGPLPCDNFKEVTTVEKVTSFTNRLTPVCWHAFDVVKIWVKANIRSRSTQAQDPLNCPTCLTNFHLFPCLKPGISVYLFNMLDNIKGCFAWFDLDLMFTLTQILTTSESCQWTGVVSTMDIEAQGAKLCKKLEKIQWQLTNNPDLSQTKRKKLEDEVDDIKEKLKAFENQLTPLAVTKLVHETHRC